MISRLSKRTRNTIAKRARLQCLPLAGDAKPASPGLDHHPLISFHQRQAAELMLQQRLPWAERPRCHLPDDPIDLEQGTVR